MPSSDKLAKNRIRSRIEAAALDRMAPAGRELHRGLKQETIGAMTGTIVELGPGTGVNMRWYPPGVKVIGIEPNPNMHERLRHAAAQHSVGLDLRTVVGETIDLEDEVADHIVCTLVLCGVDDPGQVLSEARRVLKPGGSLFFIEHVVAPDRSAMRQVQRVVKLPHRFMANGCEVDRDTAATLTDAGFSTLDLEQVDTGWQNAYARHHIVGTATK